MNNRLFLYFAAFMLFISPCLGQEYAEPAHDVTVYRDCFRVVADRDTFDFVTVKFEAAKYGAGVKVTILFDDDDVLRYYEFSQSYLYVFPERRYVIVGHGDITMEGLFIRPEIRNEDWRLIFNLIINEYKWFGQIKTRGLDL